MADANLQGFQLMIRYDFKKTSLYLLNRVISRGINRSNHSKPRRCKLGNLFTHKEALELFQLSGLVLIGIITLDWPMVKYYRLLNQLLF